MANLISKNNNNVGADSVVGSESGNVATLSDICNFLQPPNLNKIPLQPGALAYDHIISMMRGLDLQDDGIELNKKIKVIETDFCNIVHDENILCESMEYINEKALADAETALKFALLFSSRSFDALAMNKTKVRSAMLKILETNFLNADTYRVQDRDRLYNSITLLGEYYNRVRLADNSPITILGESLLDLLVREVSETQLMDVKLAKLIVSQITLNGDLLRAIHKAEATQLLFHIRRIMIEQPNLKPAVKALLLMTLDLFYSNFASLGQQLEAMYTKYYLQGDEDEGNNNISTATMTQSNQQVQSAPSQTYQKNTSPQHKQQQQTSRHHFLEQSGTTTHDKSFENGSKDTESSVNVSYESAPVTKKWSEQVCEEYNELNQIEGTEVLGNGGDTEYNNYEIQQHHSNSANNLYEDKNNSGRNSRRSNHHSKSPNARRGYNSMERSDQQIQAVTEEDDETKPLPRWRTTRFNRDFKNIQEARQRMQRRFNGSFDDDQQSVRSEGGSIRLYSVNDRLKSTERNNSSYTSTNWDRQSQRDDRSVSSYTSNYERGGNHRRGNRNYQKTYDKPPRFQKNQQNKDNSKIYSDTWQRSNNNNNNINNNRTQRKFGGSDDYHDYHSNGPESNSRDSSRARTLPRPGKSNMEGGSIHSVSYRRSQSPTQRQYNRRGQRNGPRSFNNSRYSSQSSLSSDATSQSHSHQHSRNYGRRSYHQDGDDKRQQDWEETHSLHGQVDDGVWDSKDNNSELIRNARQTAKYLNYLSAKK